jgi:Rrf2 family protein
MLETGRLARPGKSSPVNHPEDKTMKLSTKSTYGLRAMLNIALDSGKGAVSAADISEREGISVDYLEQLLARLRRGGLVESRRGSGGGYVLSRAAGGITVGDIVRSLEAIAPIHCVTAKEKGANICKKNSSCVPKVVWLKLAKAISDCLDSITLKDLCCEARKMEKSDNGKG